jgi:glycerol-1-phosphatase
VSALDPVTGIKTDSAHSQPLAQRFDCILFDLDGVLYRGSQAIKGASETMKTLVTMNIGRSFITNNASKTPAQVAAHLRELGIDAAPIDVATSPQSAVQVLEDFVAQGRVSARARVYVVGGEGIEWALHDGGFESTRDPEGCQVVMQGFGPLVSWSELAEAAYLVANGALWIATNLDSTFPTDKGIAPGNGSLVNAVAAAAGRGPDGVGGKPAPALLEFALEQSGAHYPLMVGDRYDTDIAGAIAVGIPSLLVLSGVCDAQEVWISDLRSHYLAEDVTALIETYPDIDLHGDSATCEGAIATLNRADRSAKVSGGSEINGLRALDALKWQLLEEGFAGCARGSDIAQIVRVEWPDSGLLEGKEC